MYIYVYVYVYIHTQRERERKREREKEKEGEREREREQRRDSEKDTWGLSAGTPTVSTDSTSQTVNVVPLPESVEPTSPESIQTEHLKA